MSCCCVGARHLVQQQKRCFRDGNFDLDLTYISAPKIEKEKGEKRLIAMGYPATGIESFYRNRYEDVERMLTFYHKDRYRVYNLCREKKHQYKKGCDFAGNFESHPMWDHNPTSLPMLAKVSSSIHTFLLSHKDNVCAIHCKAGKGRTGTVLCTYIVYTELGLHPPPAHFTESEFIKISSDVMARYAHQRSKDMRGVSIPSQRRYVAYWGRLLYLCWGTRPMGVNAPLSFEEISTVMDKTLNKPIVICSVSMSGFRYSKGVYLAVTLGFDTKSPDLIVRGSPQDDGSIGFPLNVLRHGDLRFSLHTKRDAGVGNEICHFWINVGLDRLSVLRLSAEEIDMKKSSKTGKEIILIYLSEQ